MYVLHVIPSLSKATGGPAYSVPTLCRHLCDLGVETRILTVDTPQFGEEIGKRISFEKDRPSIKSVSCFGSPRLRVFWSPAFVPAMINEILRRRPAVVHNHGFWSNENHSAAAWSKVFGVPLVCSPRGMANAWAMQYKSVKKKIAWTLYQRADFFKTDAFHATTQIEAEGLLKLGCKRRIGIIPNGVDIPTRPHEMKEPGAIHTALFLSRISKTKGLLELVDGWAKIRPKDWICKIAGADENGYRDVIEKRIRALGLEAVCQFVGPVEGETKDRLLREADLFVFPSYSENFGIVVAEALSYGVPVITTDGTPWQCLNDESIGWCVERGTEPFSKALAEAVSLGAGRLYEMGRRGRLFVQTKFSWRKTAALMGDFYAQAISDARRNGKCRT